MGPEARFLILGDSVLPIKLKVQLLLVIENDLPTCIEFYCVPLQLRILNFRYLLVHQFRH